MSLVRPSWRFDSSRGLMFWPLDGAVQKPLPDDERGGEVMSQTCDTKTCREQANVLAVRGRYFRSRVGTDYLVFLFTNLTIVRSMQRENERAVMGQQEAQVWASK